MIENGATFSSSTEFKLAIEKYARDCGFEAVKSGSDINRMVHVFSFVEVAFYMSQRRAV
jgi:hypothetical protein